MVQENVDDLIILQIDEDHGVDWIWVVPRHRVYSVTGIHEQQSTFHFVGVDAMAFRGFKSTLQQRRWTSELPT